MNNQWKIPIDKLMLWSGNSWNKYDSDPVKTTLRIHYDQLMIMSDTKLLESFNMNSKLRGIFKKDVLILIVGTTSNEIRKLRFQIKAAATQCVDILREHFPVTNFGSLQTKNNIIRVRVCPKYRNIDEIFKHALENTELGSSVPLPRDYLNFIKLCLLDPAFPYFVSETMKMLQEDNLKII